MAILMKRGMSGDLVPLSTVLAAVAWVSRHAEGAAQQPPSFAGAPARNVSLEGDVREGVRKRAPNVFQKAGQLNVSKWNTTVKQCQESWEGCCPTTTTRLSKKRPTRPEGGERVQWRSTVDDYTLALMESFGHRDLVQTKNPDYAIRTSTWHCGECHLMMRTRLSADGVWEDFQVQGITQEKVDQDASNYVCALPPRLRCRTPTCEPPMCQTPMLK